MKKNVSIIWSEMAKESLLSIYLYHKQFSETGAKKIKNQLLLAPKSILYSKQYQIDNINPKYRRIVLRDYKILYIEKNNDLLILDIICTLQSPEVLKNK